MCACNLLVGEVETGGVLGGLRCCLRNDSQGCPSIYLWFLKLNWNVLEAQVPTISIAPAPMGALGTVPRK